MLLSLCKIKDKCSSRIFTVFAIEAIEDVDKELVNEVHHFAVMLINGHLKIQASEFTQMSMCK